MHELFKIILCLSKPYCAFIIPCTILKISVHIHFMVCGFIVLLECRTPWGVFFCMCVLIVLDLCSYSSHHDSVQKSLNKIYNIKPLNRIICYIHLKTEMLNVKNIISSHLDFTNVIWRLCWTFLKLLSDNF